MSKGTPFPIDPVLTGIVIAFQNAELVADRVLPRQLPRLPKKEFKYWKFDFAQGITIQDTKVGRKSEPNTMEFEGAEIDDSVDDYGLDDVVPVDDINQAPANYDPRAFAAQSLINLVMLDREVRTANKVFSAANYASSNKVTLSGTDQWSDAGSDPIGDFEAAKDAMIMKPNAVVMGRATWSSLRRNAQILKAISYSGTDQGLATIQAVQDLLEIPEIIVGESWVNTAKPGQAATRARTWGKHALLFRKDNLATNTNGMPTFGFTAQYGERVSGSLPEPKTGLRGSERVRAGESVKEVICAPELGYFIQNAVA